MLETRTLLLAFVMLAAPALAQAAPTPPRGHEAAATEIAEKVNINTADVTQLMTLSGIGRHVAEKIVDYRTTHGPFKKPEEIRRVDGIGAGLWERNRARISIE